MPIGSAVARMALVSVAGLVAAGLIATGLGGCADMSGIAPKAQLREIPLLAQEKTTALQAPAPSADWWRDFGDDTLNALEERALQANPNLGLAQARLARAQSFEILAQSAGSPQLTGQLDLTRQRYTGNGAVPPPLAGSVRSTGILQVAGNWELNFFGKNRAALDSAIGSANAARLDVDAARELLASQVARGYFQLLRLNEQAAVASGTLAQRAQNLQLVQERVAAGLDTALELRQSEGSLPEARLQLETVQEQIALARNALFALVGEQNIDFPHVPLALFAIKTGVIESVIPADLLGRRADITAARWRVEAASSDVANAKTQFYPNLNLVAFAGVSSIGLGRLLEGGSQQGGVGPALRLPIFDAGRLRANLHGKTADLDAAVESYNAAVVDALRDAADQLASSQAIARQQTEQRNAATASESAYAVAVQRYQAGLGNSLNVLAAETAVLAQRRLAVDLAGRALDTRVALVRALGGSYSAAPSGMLQK